MRDSYKDFPAPGINLVQTLESAQRRRRDKQKVRIRVRIAHLLTLCHLGDLLSHLSTVSAHPLFRLLSDSTVKLQQYVEMRVKPDGSLAELTHAFACGWLDCSKMAEEIFSHDVTFQQADLAALKEIAVDYERLSSHHPFSELTHAAIFIRVLADEHEYLNGKAARTFIRGIAYAWNEIYHVARLHDL